MARARLVKPGLFTNDVLAEVSFAGRLLFIGLWTLADKEGRIEDRPKKIRGELFPHDQVDADAELTALDQYGFIKRYEVNGKRYIQVLEFKKHQSPHPREAESQIPAMDQPPAEPEQGCAEPLASNGPGTALALPSPSVPIAVAVAVPIAGSSVAETVSADEPPPGAEAPTSPPSLQPKPKIVKPPPKTDVTEDWLGEVTGLYGPFLRDIEEEVKFHMGGSYFRGRDDKRGYLLGRLDKAVGRQNGGRTLAELRRTHVAEDDPAAQERFLQGQRYERVISRMVFEKVAKTPAYAREMLTLEQFIAEPEFGEVAS